MKRLDAALSTALVLAAALAAAPGARADVPAWVDGPVFARHCADLRTDRGCPTCRCEAVTSTPSGSFARTATDYTHGILVELDGVAADGGAMIHELRVALGNEQSLVDGGAVVDLTGGPSARADWEPIGSKQLYDMCPGSCEHTPVGAIHAFELGVTRVTSVQAGELVEELRERVLAACFEQDEAPLCVVLPLGSSLAHVVTKPGKGAKPKRKALGGWSRGWSQGGKSGMQLVLTKPKGKVPKGHAVVGAARASFFSDLPQRPDAVVAPR